MEIRVEKIILIFIVKNKIMTQEQKHSIIQAILTFISSILCAITASACAMRM